MTKFIFASLLLVLAAALLIERVKVTPILAPFEVKTLNLSERSVEIQHDGTMVPRSSLPNLRVSNVRITEEQPDLIHVTLDYDFTPLPHLKNLGVGGTVSGQNIQLSDFGFRPSRLAPEEHTATFALVFNDSNEMDHAFSDEITLNFYPPGGSTLHSLVFNYEKHWCKNKVDLLTAWRYCSLPSHASQTAFHIKPELLNASEKFSEASTITDGPPQTPQEFNGNFNTGLQGWQFDRGITYSPDGGNNKSGGLRMGADVYIPDLPKYWRDANAYLCLPAAGIESLSLQAQVKLEEIPEYTRAHEMTISWHKTPDCSLGGNQGGVAYIKQQLGWQTLYIDNVKAMLGAKSLKIRLSQSRSHGQKQGLSISEFRARYVDRASEAPAPIVAVWDNIQLEIRKSKPRHAEIISSTITTYNNLLNNPSFDATTAGWRGAKKEYWKPFAGGETTILETRLHSDRGHIGTGAFNQCINLESNSGQAFDAGIKYQNVPGYTPGGGRLRLTWYEGADCTGKYEIDAGSDDISPELAGWVSLEIYDRQRPKNSSSVSMTLIHSIKENGERRIWWNDAYFYAVR